MPAKYAAELPSRLDFTVDASKEAAEFIMCHYQSPELAVERKRDSSPVTAADQGAEELLRKLIGIQFPDDGILGEEFPDTPSRSESSRSAGRRSPGRRMPRRISNSICRTTAEAIFSG